MSITNSTYPDRWSTLWCKSFSDTSDCNRCRLRYTGEYCEIDHLDSVEFLFLTVIMQILSIIAFLGIAVVSLMGLVYFHKFKKLAFPHPGYLALTGIFLSSISRSLTIIDIWSIYTITSDELFQWLYWVPFGLIIWSISTIIGVWADLLYTEIGGDVDFSFSLARKISIGSFSAYTSLIFLTLLYGMIASNWQLVYLALNGITMLMVVVLSVMNIVFGLKLLGNLKGTGKSKVTAQFLIINAVFLLLGLLITIWFYVLHGISNTQHNEYAYAFIATQYVLRIDEFGLYYSCLLILCGNPRLMIQKIMRSDKDTMSTKESIAISKQQNISTGNSTTMDTSSSY
eukprot:TRINITY_DN11591_c0_g1_i1.p1 TRINITY_DN11591_c0_g1~~TRINITY_DN11591_c0_g1_i1.p1  ORF type:complete len:342 (-),score=41.49 TRINITY_DN11591_c0_g1_i1:50-1075(-)